MSNGIQDDKKLRIILSNFENGRIGKLAIQYACPHSKRATKTPFKVNIIRLCMMIPCIL
jgi:hypothetical protein